MRKGITFTNYIQKEKERELGEIPFRDTRRETVDLRQNVMALQAPKPKIVVVNGKKYVDRFYQIAGW